MDSTAIQVNLSAHHSGQMYRLRGKKRLYFGQLSSRKSCNRIDRLLGERENNTMFDPASHSHSNLQLDTLKQYPRPSLKPRSRGLWRYLAFLALVLLLMVGVISLGDSPNYFPPILVQQFPVQLL